MNKKKQEIIFVEKVAVIFLETYKASLVIADSDINNYYLTLCKESENVNLGIEADKDHFLKKPQIDEVIKVLKNYKKLCDVYEVTRTVAVCNFNPASKPKNIYSFFDEIFASCGFRFSLMSNDEQNSAIYFSAINTYDMPKAFVSRIGADTINMVLYNRRNVVGQALLPFGPASIIDMYNKEEGISQSSIFAKAKKYIISHLADYEFTSNLDEEFCVLGTGYLYTDIAKMVRKYKKYPLDRDDNLEITKEDLEFLEKQLLELNLDATKRIKGIEETRGDVFTVAVMLALELLKRSGKDKMFIGERSLESGVMLREFVPQVLEKPISDVLGFSVVSQTVHYDPEHTKHNEQVYNLCMLLFKQLRVLHKLPRGYVKVLRAASYMHDAGKRINTNNHARLAFPVITNSEIFGLSHRELILAAFVASLHEGGEVAATEWVKYKDILVDEDVDAVKKLGAILRLAESFDHTQSNVIVDISCDILGDSVIMKTIAVGDNSYEIEKAEEGAKEFEKYFHKKIEIL